MKFCTSCPCVVEFVTKVELASSPPVLDVDVEVEDTLEEEVTGEVELDAREESPEDVEDLINSLGLGVVVEVLKDEVMLEDVLVCDVVRVDEADDADAEDDEDRDEFSVLELDLEEEDDRDELSELELELVDEEDRDEVCELELEEEEDEDIELDIEELADCVEVEEDTEPDVEELEEEDIELEVEEVVGFSSFRSTVDEDSTDDVEDWLSTVELFVKEAVAL